MLDSPPAFFNGIHARTCRRLTREYNSMLCTPFGTAVRCRLVTMSRIAIFHKQRLGHGEKLLSYGCKSVNHPFNMQLILTIT
jgi:hypothetical protein